MQARGRYTSIMYRFFAAMFLIAALAPYSTAFAQNFTGVDPLTVSISPSNPRPYQTVTVTPGSTLIDLLSGTVRVSVNGKSVAEGSGASSVPVTVGGPGESTVISVRVVVAGQTYVKEITIRPADVALVVDPVSTAHPFYEGASLPAVQGRVRIVAVADMRSNPGTRLGAQNLVYTWKLGDKILADQSGIGRSVLTATAPVRYRDAQVSVTVTSPDNANLVATAATTIAPVDPVIRIYRDDALMGPLFDHALTDSYTMGTGEESFRAVAYFFGAPPSLSWAVNDQVSSTDKDVTVRTTGSGAGIASLSLTATSPATNQTASNRLSVHFGAKSSFNLFGF